MSFIRLIIVFLGISIFLDGTPLKKKDLRETFEEMLAMHVEHNQISPVLLTRAVKIFIEQFDPGKMYFLDEEVKNLQLIGQREINQGLKAYFEDDLYLFSKINECVEGAIIRNKRWRQEIEKELILSMYNVPPQGGETYLAYADSEKRLKKRVRKQLVHILIEEKKINKLDDWSPKDREKIFTLWERRFSRKESEYLVENSSSEHFLTLHSIKALAKSLDAHTAYFSPEDALEMRSALEKQFEGIGVVFREGIDGIVVEDLVKGGPAEKSGKVQVGDQIVSVNGMSVTGLPYEQVLEALKGKDSSEIILSFSRKGNGQLNIVKLAKEKVVMANDRLKVSSHPCANGHIGLLSLPSFYEGGRFSSAEADMREAIKKLKKDAPLKGIILDMRENSGGFLTQAVKVSSLFVSRGVIVISKYSKGEIKYLRNLDGKPCFDGPLIILTSRASASATEIVAQALQDYAVALIVGDKETYGKGTIQYQTLTNSDAKKFYKVTVGRYYTVSGRSTQIEGVKADIVVPTAFSSFNIGERFLDNSLSTDQVAAAYIDPLTDIDHRNRVWFQKNYLPNLHQPGQKWPKILPRLKENSTLRLTQDKNFKSFLKIQEKMKGNSPRLFRKIPNPEWGHDDLQISEALNIMKDMIAME